MKILILGAAGFIGTNLCIELAKDKNNIITLVDKCEDYFQNINSFCFKNISIIVDPLDKNTNFDKILSDQDVVYHLVSTNVPTTSNQHISLDMQSNVIFSTNLFDACVRNQIHKVIFISSGGTVYGKEANCPLPESTPTYPITSYGVQKVTIEKLLYLYNYMYGLDYKIVRLANPYGPYQKPNGVLGAVTTFTYKALKNEEINVYGDGSVIRDFIYIEDAVRGIVNIANCDCNHHIFNLGCGYGTSIEKLLNIIKETLNVDMKIKYLPSRTVDVPINYLDISIYEKYCGKLNPLSLRQGILMTAEFMKKNF